MSSKLNEAQEHVRAAEKFLKTSFLKWKPDYDSAADEYSQAAQCYRIARDLKNSKDCHMKASEFYLKNKSFFHAAKAIENAIIVAKEIIPPEENSDFIISGTYTLGEDDLQSVAENEVAVGPITMSKSDECSKVVQENEPTGLSEIPTSKSREDECLITVTELYQMAEDSSSLYQQHGSGDAGANVLDKTAKIIEEKAPEKALILFQHAADVSSTESGQHQAAEYISKASRILVKLGMYDQAVDSLRREIGFHQEHGASGAIGRLTVAVVLVQLARGDCVAAEKAYKEWGNNCEVAEMQTIELLLSAYDEEDREAARRALASPFLRHMDVEYARLAQTVPLPAVMEVVATPATARQGDNTDEERLEMATLPPPDGEPQPAEKSDEEDELC